MTKALHQQRIPHLEQWRASRKVFHALRKVLQKARNGYLPTPGCFSEVQAEFGFLLSKHWMTRLRLKIHPETEWFQARYVVLAKPPGSSTLGRARVVSLGWQFAGFRAAPTQARHRPQPTQTRVARNAGPVC